MLHKLQSLTNSLTCQNCRQVLSFAKFFDEDHNECLNKFGAPSAIVQNAVNVLPSQGGSESIEEIKEARALLAPIEATPTKVKNL